MIKKYSQLKKASSVIVYHGTDISFPPAILQKGKNWGLHFGTLEAAKKRGNKIYKCHISINSSCELPDLNDWVPQEVAKELKMPDLKKIQNLDSYAEKYAEIEKYLQDNGFDSIQYLNEIEDPGSISYMIWDISQLVKTEFLSSLKKKSVK